jgi:hypothetical protein
MYITNKGYTYYRGSEQRHTRAPFLLLVQDRDIPLGPDNFRALVRKVAMRQCGHFMMGVARINGKSLTVSGSYGGDGLPMDVDKDVYDKGVDVPRRLYDLCSKGGGWNSAGSEAQEMRRWVKDTFRKEEL